MHEDDQMKIGVSLPQTDIGTDPIIVRDFAQAAEEIGFDHLGVSDHVVGVNPESYPDWSGPYTSDHAFHDPFALSGYLAGQNDAHHPYDPYLDSSTASYRSGCAAGRFR